MEMSQPNNAMYESNEQGTENYSADYEPQLGQAIGSAVAYFFSMLAFILFVCPFAFWKGATLRLYKACKSRSLHNFVQSSRWPYLTFLKKVFFEFIIDGTMFISYFVGALIALYTFFTTISDYGLAIAFSSFLLTLIGTYYFPMLIALIRDFFVLLLLPFQKFLSWVSKPAQQIDVDFHNH